MPAGPVPTATPDAAHHQQVLRQLIDAGLDIALNLQAQIQAFTPPPPAPDAPPPHPLDRLDVHACVPMAGASAELALAFARVSRAVRLSIALHDRLAKGEALEPSAVRVARTPVSEGLAEAPEADRPCRERRSDRERLDSLPDLPVDEIIARIRADLGLAPEWPMLTEADRATDTGLAPAADAPEPDPSLATVTPTGSANDAPDDLFRPSG